MLTRELLPGRERHGDAVSGRDSIEYYSRDESRRMRSMLHHWQVLSRGGHDRDPMLIHWRLLPGRERRGDAVPSGVVLRVREHNRELHRRHVLSTKEHERRSGVRSRKLR